MSSISSVTLFSVLCLVKKQLCSKSLEKHCALHRGNVLIVYICKPNFIGCFYFRFYFCACYLFFLWNPHKILQVLLIFIIFLLTDLLIRIWYLFKMHTNFFIYLLQILPAFEHILKCIYCFFIGLCFIIIWPWHICLVLYGNLTAIEASIA